MIIFDQNPTFLDMIRLFHGQLCFWPYWYQGLKFSEWMCYCSRNIMVILEKQFEPRSPKIAQNRTFFEFFQVQWSKWVANDPFRATKHHKIAKKLVAPMNKSRHEIFSLCSHLVVVVVTYQTNISADSYIRWFRKNRFKVDPLNVFRGFTN